jgi:prepilin-type N-terminal cleavage/methylation domain-containing protein
VGAGGINVTIPRKVKTVRLSNKAKKGLQGSSPGMTLIEVLVALALFAIIAIAFANGLGTASKAGFTADVRTNAESLARTEMEYVKTQDYSAGNWSYVVTHLGSTCIPEECPDWDDLSTHSLSEEHALYTVEVEAVPLDDESGDPIQKIIVTVSHEGRDVITLEGYKIDR